MWPARWAVADDEPPADTSGGGGDDEEPPADNQDGDCFSNSTLLYQAMLGANSFVPETYVICPNTVVQDGDIVSEDDESELCAVETGRCIFGREARSCVEPMENPPIIVPLWKGVHRSSTCQAS